LQSAPFDPKDQKKINFLGISTEASVDNILKIAGAVKYWTVPMSADELVNLKAVINGNGRFGVLNRLQLRGVLPNVTTTDILRAALRFLDLGPDYSDRAANLYERVESHPEATADDILLGVSFGCKELGDRCPGGSAERMKYHDRAAALHERAGNHPEATPLNIIHTAYRLSNLGPDYYGRSAVLFERAGNHPEATPENILEAAHRLSNLGPGYYDRALTLLELAENHPEATLINIIHTADGFSDDLGPDYYGRAAALYERAGSHPNATSRDMLEAAQRLRNLGPDYYERVAVLFERAVNHPEATSINIIQTAGGLKSLGTEYYDRAATLLNVEGIIQKQCQMRLYIQHRD
jgi:hypothetical protein